MAIGFELIYNQLFASLYKGNVENDYLKNLRKFTHFPRNFCKFY